MGCALAMLSACTVGPQYQRPNIAVPAAFKEQQGWKQAEPRDAAPRQPWWEVYGDAQLNALIEQVAIANENVHIAAAQYRAARALVDSARAAKLPTVTANASITRGQSAPVSAAAPIFTTATTDRIALGATWEADLWGRISSTVEVNETAAQASAADLQSVLLSAQSLLAQSYLQLRVNDAQSGLLARTIKEYERALEITSNRYRAGVASRLDVTQAETQLRSTQAQAIDLELQRAQLEHAIAVLLGKTPAEFSIAKVDALPLIPETVVAIPSELLEHRPDIAGAERRVASANAQIGVAQAAYYPSLILTANGGFQGSSFSHLLTAPHRFWSIGPALVETLFDGGARSAQKEQALANYDKSVASYRATVLSAFQQVEDDLAALRILDRESETQHAAVTAAQESVRVATNQYDAGLVSYLNVVTAQTTALSTERSALDLASRRLAASVALLRDLGGNWSTQMVVGHY